MSNMKCPFCGLELRSSVQQEQENTHITWHCPKCESGKYKWACGNKTLWQALIDTKKKLERTHKALEIAKDTLHWYDDNYDSVVARNTLDEITALEQKD